MTEQLTFKQIFANQTGTETRDLVERDESIKDLIKPLFKGLSKTESEIVIYNIKDFIEENLKIVI